LISALIHAPEINPTFAPKRFKIPTENTAAWLLVPGGPFTIKEALYTKSEPWEIVIKNHAVAINPRSYYFYLSILTVKL
jgi:hypothetical protein